MNEPTNDGGPAFPVQDMSGGMSLRDYFAAKAMIAALMPDTSGSVWRGPEEMAAWAYSQADAMLKARQA